MRKLALLLALVVVAGLSAQEGYLPDWDFDSLFSEPAPAPETGEPAVEAAPITVTSLLRQRGFTLAMSYVFMAGIAPGFHEAPWFWNSLDDSRHHYLERLFNMRHSFVIDSQVSESFRVSSGVYFSVPNFNFAFGHFWFDYNFHDNVFVRAGMFNTTWGISRNYNFTNLLARIPDDIPARPAQGATVDRPAIPARPARTFNRQALMFRADIPSGIGGFQVLALTRANVLGNIDVTDAITREDVGLGARYNLALRRVDLTMGMFHMDRMPFRTFVSASTSFLNTDWYSEGMIAIGEDSGIRGAMNLGFTRDIFSNNFTINGELFFTGEENARWRHPGTALIQDGYATHFIQGLNVAFNLLYHFTELRGEPRLAIQYRFALSENSGQLIPTLRVNLWPNIELLLAAPMALGSRGGYYHQHSVRLDTGNRDSLSIPFGFMALIRLTGSVRLDHRY